MNNRRHYTLDDWFEAWLAGCKTPENYRNSDKYKGRQKIINKYERDFLPLPGGFYLYRATLDDISEYIDEEKKAIPLKKQNNADEIKDAMASGAVDFIFDIPTVTFEFAGKGAERGALNLLKPVTDAVMDSMVGDIVGSTPTDTMRHLTDAYKTHGLNPWLGKGYFLKKSISDLRYVGQRGDVIAQTLAMGNMPKSVLVKRKINGKDEEFQAVVQFNVWIVTTQSPQDIKINKNQIDPSRAYIFFSEADALNFAMYSKQYCKKYCGIELSNSYDLKIFNEENIQDDNLVKSVKEKLELISNKTSDSKIKEQINAILVTIDEAKNSDPLVTLMPLKELNNQLNKLSNDLLHVMTHEIKRVELSNTFKELNSLDTRITPKVMSSIRSLYDNYKALNRSYHLKSLKRLIINAKTIAIDDRLSDNQKLQKIINLLENEYEKQEKQFCKPFLSIGRTKIPDEFVKRLNSNGKKYHYPRLLAITLNSLYSYHALSGHSSETKNKLVKLETHLNNLTDKDKEIYQKRINTLNINQPSPQTTTPRNSGV